MGEVLASLWESIKNTSALEFVAVFLALVYVVLASRQDIFCWLAGLLSVAIYIYICYHAKLYLETFLQIFYFFISVYGWYQWMHGAGKEKELQVSTAGLRKILLITLPGFLVSIIVGYLFHRYTSAALPYLDAFVTVFSILATWMTAKKILENWLSWIVIDAVAIILYSKRGLYLSGVLYFVYTLVAIYGYKQWKKSMSTGSFTS